MAVSFKELDGSPNVSVGIDSVDVTRRFKVAWSSRKTFVQELLGEADVDYPEAVCEKCTVKALPAKVLSTSGNFTSYEFAVIEAHYSSSAVTTVTETFEPSADFITLDPTLFRWGSASGDELQPNEAPGKLNVTMDYTLTWKNLSTVPGTAFQIIGCINSGDLNPKFGINSRLINFTFPAYTLLYHPPVATRTWDFLLNREAWDLTYRFTYRPNWDGAIARGWNWVWRASTGRYERIYSVTSGAPIVIYETAGFLGLW